MIFLTIIVVALLAGVFRAPAFLVCERPLEKVDCVIAMLGGDFAGRKREALSLIEKGIADVMLVPAWRKMSATAMGKAGTWKSPGFWSIRGLYDPLFSLRVLSGR